MAFEPRIIAFTCNWCAYAGADYAGVSRIQYPANVRIIRVMCSGRIEPAFILKAFESGADGVLVGGCHEADCHYKTGNMRAKEGVESTGRLLDLLGLGSDRLRIKWVNANEGEQFAEEITDFVKALKKLGPNPLKKARQRVLKAPSLDDSIESTNAMLCVECGKCTASCPVARRNPEFSPRKLVEYSLENLVSDLEKTDGIWECLTCATCEERCPFDVRFSDFIYQRRVASKEIRDNKVGTKSGLMYSWMRIMASEGIRQNRTSFTDGMRIKRSASSKNDIMYFVGCLPYYEISHSYIRPGSLDIAKNTISILNAAGITPVVLENECCCGHDLLAAGDTESFETLAKKNAKAIKEAGVRRVVFSCPEGYLTFSREYPRVIKNWDIDVMHITELTSKLLDEKKISFNKTLEMKVTYQDPCRLGRHMGIYEAPRKVINSIPGVELVEMKHSGADAICCGVSSWVLCGATSKCIQIDRLEEACSTGADALLTSCPKCLIHFRCALSGKVPTEREKPAIDVHDITSIIAKAMKAPGVKSTSEAKPISKTEKKKGKPVPTKKAAKKSPKAQESVKKKQG
ncbi:MAG: hydrogenase iron-sulfur subunit [Actinomycetota bacterium]|nr:hydrogenase iron-sulfur subunit [Actinomycetota bacterium]